MRHKGTRPIETERLLLRRFTPADAEAMFRNWANDPEVTRWMRWEPHADVTETRAVLKSWMPSYLKPSYYHWAIVLKETGEPIGSLGIMYGSQREGLDDPEPGYCIGRSWWGQGYTTEALQAAMDYFTAATGTKTMMCCHAVENPASGGVLRKVGFTYTHDGHYTKFDGTRVPAKWYIWRGR